MKSIAIFALVSLAITAGVAWLLGLVWRTGAEQHAILVSAVVAYFVQLLAFSIARLVARTNVIAGWGLGALLRFATLAVYAFIIIDAFALPSAAALVSLVAFFFLSTLVEPLLLNA